MPTGSFNKQLSIVTAEIKLLEHEYSTVIISCLKIVKGRKTHPKTDGLTRTFYVFPMTMGDMPLHVGVSLGWMRWVTVK